MCLCVCSICNVSCSLTYLFTLSLSLKEKVKEWTNDEALSFEFVYPVYPHAVTSVDPTINPWWKAFQDAADNLKIKITPEIFPAATDGRYLRQIGIPCFGFSPMSNTKVLLHEHNEYIGVDTYVKGIDIYVQLITHLASVDI